MERDPCLRIGKWIWAVLRVLWLSLKGSMPEDRKVDMGCIKSPLVISEGIHA